MWAMCVSWVFNSCIYIYIYIFLILLFGIQFTVEYSLIRRPCGLGVRIWKFTWWAFIALFVDIQIITDGFGHACMFLGCEKCTVMVGCSSWALLMNIAQMTIFSVQAIGFSLQQGSVFTFFVVTWHCNETVLCIWDFSQVSFMKQRHADLHSLDSVTVSTVN